MNRLWIAGLGLLVLGFGVFWLFKASSSDEARIRQHLDELSHQLRIEAEQNPLAFAGQVRALEAFFIADLEIHFKAGNYPPVEIRGWNQLRERMLQGRAYLESLRLSFKDLEIQVEDDRAVVELTVIASGETREAQQPHFHEATEARIELKREEGRDWQVSKLENVEAVRFR